MSNDIALLLVFANLFLLSMVAVVDLLISYSVYKAAIEIANVLRYLSLRETPIKER